MFVFTLVLTVSPCYAIVTDPFMNDPIDGNGSDFTAPVITVSVNFPLLVYVGDNIPNVWDYITVTDDVDGIIDDYAVIYYDLTEDQIVDEMNSQNATDYLIYIYAVDRSGNSVEEELYLSVLLDTNTTYSGSTSISESGYVAILFMLEYIMDITMGNIPGMP
jgi:hypothetical protein